MSVHPAVAGALLAYKQGHAAQAEATLRQFLTRHPLDPVAGVALAQLCVDSGRGEQGEFLAQRVLGAQPHHAGAMIVVARARWAQGKADEAMTLARKATEVEPRSTIAWVLRGDLAAGALLEYDEAIECFGRAAALGPNLEALQRLAQTWGLLGCYEQSVEILQRALSMSPSDPRTASLLAFAMNYVSEATAQQVADAHAHAGRCIAQLPTLPLSPPTMEPLAGRPLRVGLISGDLRQHPVGVFIEPLLRARDPNAIEYFAYSLSDHTDALSARLKSHCLLWRSLVSLREADAATLILRDQLDVLIDLAGHTAPSGLWLMRHRLAPVQATYLGYPHTTGLSTIDLRIVDGHTDPDGSDWQATERLVRLNPCMHVYTPPEGAPPVRDSAGRTPGPIRFGSLNVAGKISTLTAEIWATILHATPGSTLHVKSNNLQSTGAWRHVIQKLVRAGVDAARVIALPRTANIPEHLAQYHELDIALDPTPYNGTTTTCEALFMGVPVVSMWGDRHAARVTGSILKGIGLAELLGDSPETYVKIACALAQDPARLAGYRAGLRDRLCASPLSDALSVARQFESYLLCNRQGHDADRSSR